MTEPTAIERADELYGRVRRCTLCVLSRTRQNAVPGEGPLDAEIMFIGEAPGANEDKQGRPFVGQAGQFLSELLGAAGLRREEVYICNVLKCRPPGNRDPLPDEIASCKGYLDEQIELIDPPVIVTLGRYSMARWFPQQTISRVHGRFRILEGRYYVPMYHPAAALHQQNLRDVLLEDFRALPAIVQAARAARIVAAAPDVSMHEQPAGCLEAPGAVPTIDESEPSTTAPAKQARLFE
ncbi:MAG: uracil-DNA glycosylase family protein [Tepidiformaceae bacterium]